jgi:hypothetical protein
MVRHSGRCLNPVHQGSGNGVQLMQFTLPGRANWWLPGWLDRVLPRGPVGIDAESAGEAGGARVLTEIR